METEGYVRFGQGVEDGGNDGGEDNVEGMSSKEGERRPATDREGHRALAQWCDFQGGTCLGEQGAWGSRQPGDLGAQLQRKHSERKQDIREVAYALRPEEKVDLKVGNILPKSDMNAAPGPSGLRNDHIRIWAGYRGGLYKPFRRRS